MGILTIIIAALTVPRAEWNGIFTVSYPALVISLRGFEGMLIGHALPSKRKLWHLPLGVVLAVGLFVALYNLPYPGVKLGLVFWSVIGAAIASLGFALKMRTSLENRTRSPFVAIALFLMLLSTTLYVQSSGLRHLQQWILSVGLAIGIYASKKGITLTEPTESSAASHPE